MPSSCPSSDADRSATETFATAEHLETALVSRHASRRPGQRRRSRGYSMKQKRRTRRQREVLNLSPRRGHPHHAELPHSVTLGERAEPQSSHIATQLRPRIQNDVNRHAQQRVDQPLTDEELLDIHLDPTKSAMNHPLQPARYASVRHLRLTACSNPELRNSKDNMAATPMTKGQLLAMLRSVHRDRRPQQGCASNSRYLCASV